MSQSEDSYSEVKKMEEDEEDIEDLMEFVEESLRHRRFAEAVRLETPPDPSKEIVDLLLSELELDEKL